MSLIIGDNFDYQGKQANFKRDTFNTLSDMKSYPETSIDEGHISFCIETGKRYKYSSKNTSDPTLGKWRLIVDTQLDATSENPVQNKAIVQKFLADEQTATQGLKTLSETYDKRISENEEAVGESLNDLNNKVEMFAESASVAINNLENTKLDSTITVNGRGINGGNNISLTKSDIGLGNVDNTSDLNKPVSNATQNALNQKVSIKSGYDLMSNTLKTKLEELPNSSSLSSMFATRDTNLSNHIKDTSNPHNVTAKQVGLDSYSPYTPSTLPISGPAQTALDGKVDKTITVNGHALSGDVTVTKSDLVIENVDNTSDINKPISKATQFALNLKADLASPALTGTPTAPTATEGTSTTQLATTAFVTSADNKKVDKTTTVNGHALSGNITVTKGDVGLGSVDNTADSDKSVKHATSADNDGSGNNIVKTYATITNLTAETSRAKSAEETNASNLSNEITRAKAAESTLQTSVSKNKSAIDILNGTSDVEGSVKKAIKDVVGAAPEALDTLEEIAKQLESDESTVKALTNTISEETTRAKTAEEANANNISTNATNLSNEITRAKAAEKANATSISSLSSGKVDKTTTVNGHALSGNVTVTKGDVGLGNCDNTSDANKPISSPTQTALNGKVDKTTTVNGHALSGNVTVTKSDVGLGNCDNTSDANKPISTATQKALDLKADLDEVLSNEDTSAESLSNLKDSLEQLQLGLSGALRDINSRLGVVENKATTGLSTSLPGNPSTGNMIFATNLGKPIWYTGSKWVDATGASI